MWVGVWVGVGGKLGPNDLRGGGGVCKQWPDKDVPSNKAQASPHIGGQVRPVSLICSGILLGYWIPPICSADLWGFL